MLIMLLVWLLKTMPSMVLSQTLSAVGALSTKLTVEAIEELLYGRAYEPGSKNIFTENSTKAMILTEAYQKCISAMRVCCTFAIKRLENLQVLAAAHPRPAFKFSQAFQISLDIADVPSTSQLSIKPMK